jgi:hypothetical protein
MAERDIVGGLFGVTPEMYQQNRQQQQMAEAVRIGSLTPEQFINTQAYRGGQMAGNVIGGLLGVEDPQLKMVRDISSMRQQYDTSSVEGLRQFAGALSERGYSDFAMQAAQKAADLEQTMATTGLRKAQAEKATSRTSVSPEQLLTSGRYTPASVAKYEASGNIADLVLSKEATGGGASKPLTASLQKAEDKDLESYDSYESQKEALLPSIVNLTKDAEGKRKLELGPLKNAEYMARNLAGNSNAESRAFEALRSAVGTAVNLQVSAEKGVQTDKDVLRFADALIAAYGKNDTEATLQALQRYYDSINRAQSKAAGRVESRRKSQNVEPYFQGQTVTTQPATAPQQAPKTIKFSDLPK